MKNLLLTTVAISALMISGASFAGNITQTSLTISCPTMSLLQKAQLSQNKVIKMAPAGLWLVSSDAPVTAGTNSFYPVVAIPMVLAHDKNTAYNYAKRMLTNTAPNSKVTKILAKDAKFGICLYENTTVTAWGGHAPSPKEYETKILHK